MDRRVHVVLVPGFGGFDDFGQISYYAGVTPLFKDWRARSSSQRRRRSVIHYFDNLPTAAVKTRADRLKRFLAKRIARNEIQERDEIALVGHSTGGLDIRQLVKDMRDGCITVDSAEEKPVVVELPALRRQIRRVVFLSVPQRGTNIADWVQSHSRLRTWAIRAIAFMLRHDPTSMRMKRRFA